MLTEAFLLDPPDHAALAAVFEAEHRAALVAQAQVTRTAGTAALVDDNVLRDVPRTMISVPRRVASSTIAAPALRARTRRSETRTP